MAGATRKWLLGCGIGCGAFILLVGAGLIGGSLVMLKPFKSAIKTREVLDERHGLQEQYTPALDGAVAPDRIETFLRVREQLMAFCDDFANVDSSIERLDELEEDASKKEVLSEAFNVSKAVFGMGPLMGEYFGARNSALLDADMGRGEYAYIYVIAYRDSLQSSSNQPSKRSRRALIQMLRNQLAGVEQRIEQHVEQHLAPAGGDTLVTIAEALRDEIRRLEDQPQQLPWQNGLPPAIAASIRAYRDALDAVYCGHTVTHEFIQNRQRAFGIQGD